MRPNRLIVVLLLMVILTSLAIIYRRPAMTGEPGAGPRVSPAPAGLAPTPASRYLAIQEEYIAADGKVVESVRAAPAERKTAALRQREDLRRTFADRFLALARDSAADPAAGETIVDALTWVIIHCPEDPRGREAVGRLLQGPILHERVGGACQRLAARKSPIAEPIFRAVLQSSPHRSDRAQATLALARTLRRRSESVGRGPGERARAEALMREADSLYTDAIECYGDLRVERETLAEIAESELFELRHLAVGREAPNIQGPDLEGRPMALRDFRGKVVVLEFWGHWCSVCQESFPQDRGLVERMRGKPFILLGVNSDGPEIGAAVARQDPIAGRTGRDGGEVLGGPIARRWNVTALPTTYIIDRRGIIRYKLGPRPDGHDGVREIFDPSGEARDKWQLRAETIEAVVVELLAEMENASDSVTGPSLISETPTGSG